MALFLPAAVAAILYLLFRSRSDSSRTALLRSAILCVTILVAIHDVLDIPNLDTRSSLAVAWAIVLCCTSVLLLRLRRSQRSHPTIDLRPAVHIPPHMATVDRALAAIVCASIAFIGLAPFVLPSDHLIVGSYDKADFTRPVIASATELIALNIGLLSGSDRLISLVGFFSLVASIVAVTLIASRFGARRTGQLLSALFVLTLPELIHGSPASTRIRLTSFFIVTACSFLLKAGVETNLLDFITAALATGLCLLTDRAATIYSPILLIGCITFRPSPVRLWMLKRLPIFIAVVLAINAGSNVLGRPISATPLGASSSDGWQILAGAAVHLALIIVCFASLIFVRLDAKDRRVQAYILSVLIAFIAYSAISGKLSLTSFSTPFFIMSAVLIGCLTERLLRRSWQVFAFAVMLLLSAAPTWYRAISTNSFQQSPEPAPQEFLPPPSSKP